MTLAFSAAPTADRRAAIIGENQDVPRVGNHATPCSAMPFIAGACRIRGCRIRCSVRRNCRRSAAPGSWFWCFGAGQIAEPRWSRDRGVDRLQRHFRRLARGDGRRLWRSARRKLRFEPVVVVFPGDARGELVPSSGWPRAAVAIRALDGAAPPDRAPRGEHVAGTVNSSGASPKLLARGFDFVLAIAAPWVAAVPLLVGARIADDVLAADQARPFVAMAFSIAWLTLPASARRFDGVPPPAACRATTSSLRDKSVDPSM